MPFLIDWHKYKVHVCCVYLLLQRWAVPLEMLTRNKVHCFLSGHRMFPPQSREHLLAYLLGEAWHLQRDCSIAKPKEDGGEVVAWGCSSNEVAATPGDALGAPGYPKAPDSAVSSTRAHLIARFPLRAL